MRRLVIDCATEACSVALFDDDSLVAGRFEMLGRGHAERLVPMIAELPDAGRADTIAVNVGPGSFTGIRVGLAAAKALALAWKAVLEGYESHALVAAIGRHDHPGTAIDVAMTGGHGEWFFQPFAADGRPIGSIASLRPEDACARSQAGLVIGTQAAALVAGRGSGESVTAWPDARRFAALPAAAIRPDPSPAYGRAPDARLPAGAGTAP